jgi:hypothetical protein
MQKILLERRPYEINKGETDATYQELLALLVNPTRDCGVSLKMVEYLEADALEPHTYPRILLSFKGEGEGY